MNSSLCDTTFYGFAQELGDVTQKCQKWRAPFLQVANASWHAAPSAMCSPSLGDSSDLTIMAQETYSLLLN
jgi:hypothetical protein